MLPPSVYTITTNDVASHTHSQAIDYCGPCLIRVNVVLSPRQITDKHGLYSPLNRWNQQMCEFDNARAARKSVRVSTPISPIPSIESLPISPEQDRTRSIFASMGNDNRNNEHEEHISTPTVTRPLLQHIQRHVNQQPLSDRQFNLPFEKPHISFNSFVTESSTNQTQYLSFLVSELNTVNDISKLLRNRGIHIDCQSSFSICSRSNCRQSSTHQHAFMQSTLNMSDPNWECQTDFHKWMDFNTSNYKRTTLNNNNDDHNVSTTHTISIKKHGNQTLGQFINIGGLFANLDQNKENVNKHCKSTTLNGAKFPDFASLYVSPLRHSANSYKENTKNGNEYILEFRFNPSQWQTSLDKAILNNDICSIKSIIQSLNVKFEDFMKYSEFCNLFQSNYILKPNSNGHGCGIVNDHLTRYATMHTHHQHISSNIQNNQIKYLQSLTIQSLETAIRLDKKHCLMAVFEVSDVFLNLQLNHNVHYRRNKTKHRNYHKCNIQRLKTINSLCYYLNKALLYQSKCCFSLMLGIWNEYVAHDETLQESGIFQSYFRHLLNRLYLIREKQKCQHSSTTKSSETHTNSQTVNEYNEIMLYIQWISSIVEPCSLSDDFVSQFYDEDLCEFHKIGRKLRFQVIYQQLMNKNAINTKDLVNIVLQYDGYLHTNDFV